MQGGGTGALERQQSLSLEAGGRSRNRNSGLSDTLSRRSSRLSRRSRNTYGSRRKWGSSTYGCCVHADRRLPGVTATIGGPRRRPSGEDGPNMRCWENDREEEEGGGPPDRR